MSVRGEGPAVPAAIARERRRLQAAIFLAGLIPIGAGLAGVVLGSRLLHATAPDAASADSHIRYLSGLLLGLGLVAWSVLPRVETAGEVFKMLTAAVLIGGCARLASLMLLGAPSWPMLGGLVMELVVTPALAFWQWRVARLCRAG